MSFLSHGSPPTSSLGCCISHHTSETSGNQDFDTAPPWLLSLGSIPPIMPQITPTPTPLFSAPHLSGWCHYLPSSAKKLGHPPPCSLPFGVGKIFLFSIPGTYFLLSISPAHTLVPAPALLPRSLAPGLSALFPACSLSVCFPKGPQNIFKDTDYSGN